MADLIDELSRQVAALLLVVLGQDQARNWVEMLASATVTELRAK